MNGILGVNGLPVGFNGSGNYHLPEFNRQNPIVQPKHIDTKPNHAINYMGDFGGCGWWRMQLPELLLNYGKYGVITSLHKLIPDEKFYSDIKTIRLQRQASPIHAEFFKHIRKIADKYGIQLVYEIDDIIFREDIPDFNRAKSVYDSDEVLKSIIDMMMLCDTMTVSCDFMKDYYSSHVDHPNIKVIPNMPSKSWFDNFYSSSDIMNKFDKNKNRPRVLYAGSGNHFDVEGKGRDDDFTHVKDAIINSRRMIKWVFLGSIPQYLMPYVKNGEMEFHKWAPVHNYPSHLNKLDVNAVVAPLMDCTFNKAKSNIKYLESACLGIPGVFQDLVTYSDAPIRFNDGNDMIIKLKRLLEDRKLYAKISKNSRSYAETMWLDDNLDIYKDLYFNWEK